MKSRIAFSFGGRLLWLVVGAALFLALVLALERTGNRDLLLVMLTLGLVTPMVLLWIERERQRRALAALSEAALRAELAALKAQVNPHFFFNTLNTLYSLAEQASPRVPELILRLSEMLRFTIDQGRLDEIRVQDEIEYLNNYLELQRIRRDAGDRVAFSAQVECNDHMLPPLLLIMLVENAFKHGFERMRADAFVRIRLRQLGRRLEFAVDNSRPESSRAHTGARRGTGLDNLRRRLELLYPGRHALTLNDDGRVYSARLWLEGR